MKKTGLLLSLLMVIAVVCQAQVLKLGHEGKNQTQVKENTDNRLVVRESLAELSYLDVKTDRGTFTLLRVDGYSFTDVIGHPRLPVKRSLISIPMGADMKLNILKSTYTEYSLAELGINHQLIPVQAPVVKDGKPLPPLVLDRQAYGRDRFSPADLASVEDLGLMRGTRIGRLNINPVHYNPVTGRVRVYEMIELELVFKNSDSEAGIISENIYNNHYFNGLKSQLLNYKAKPRGSKDTIAKYPVKYVIVSPVMFQTTLQPLIQWKRKKGFTVVEAYTNDPNVGTTTTTIKNYLRDLYQNATVSDPAPTFVLLVGDLAQLPSFTGSGGHKADMYYVEYTGDYFPEAFIGRFSAENEAQLAPQINKTLEYEKYLMPDPSFLNEVVMVSGVDASFAPIHGNGQINYGTDHYFNAAHGLTSHTYLYPLSGSSATQIRQDVSNGVAYANYTAHGGSTGWSDPSFDVSDVANLQNTGKYPLMVGNCCLTNKFDEPVCFGEALLRANGKGALGYIGGSDVTYWDEDFYFGVGVRSIILNPVWSSSEQPGAYDVMFHDHGEPFSQWYTSQSQMMFAGNMSVAVGSPGSAEYYYEVYHLMGDPSLMVYFSVPPLNTVTFASLMPLGVNSFMVNAIPYSYVAISKDGILHGAALANAQGEAVVSLSPITTPGYATIVVTGQNLQPFIDSIPVDSPQGPYVLMTQQAFSDTNGNNNGLADFGEDIDLHVTLKNWGQSMANSITASLASTDPHVTITDNSASFGNIGSGNTAQQNNAFAFTISTDVPDQHKAEFQLSIQDNLANTWSSTFKITLNAPQFVITDLLVDDATSGNGNGRLDPGETVDIVVNAKNSGHSDAPATMGNLLTLSPLFTINNGSAILNLVPYTGDVQATFTGVVNPLAQTGDYITFDYTIASGNYSATKTFSRGVGLTVEDWETGTLTHFNWQHAGSNAPWAISTEDPYEGVYCVKSGAIAHSQYTDFLIQGTVLLEDTISFFYKVSSEPGYDFLRFYIDNLKVGEWSGEIGWTRAAFLVSPGSHILKWRYRKDQADIGGSDCAWVDFIAFPPMTGLTSGVLPTVKTAFSWNVFPNPSSGQAQLYLELDETKKLNIQLFNAIGVQVANLLTEEMLSPGVYQFELPTAALPKGVYLVKLFDGEILDTKKIILQ